MTENPLAPNNLSPNEKRELLQKLLAEKAAKGAATHKSDSFHISRQSREREHFPLSSPQQRLLFLEQWEPNTPIFNNSVALRLRGPLNDDALERTLNKIIQRHEALRTIFTIENGLGVQRIIQDSKLALSIVDLMGIQGSAREAEMLRVANEEVARPIDLAHDLKLRVSLIRMSSEDHVLIITLHHISSDGWSLSVFIRELTIIYDDFVSNRTASSLPDLPIQYVDYACWQQDWLQSDAIRAQLAYWEKQLAGTPPVLDLPTDRPRPALQTFRGEVHLAIFSPELTTSLKTLARQENATLFMVLLAAFQTLLFRYTSKEDVVVGSPIAGRNFSEVKDLIGFFINTLVLRTDLSNTPTFRELLGRVRKVALDAYENQDIPFDKLVEKLQPVRNLSHSPFFQVMFILQNTPPLDFKLQGLSITQLFDITTKTSKYDITLSMMERSDGLWTMFEYNPDLFDATTISRMAGHLETLLKSIAVDPDRHLADVPVLTDAEYRQIVVDWNKTSLLRDAACIHQLFEAQVSRTPDKIALTFNDCSLTFAELNERANQLAHYLRSLGVERDILVGVYMERSLEMVIGLLGILKAGGAYVPLDPAFPMERLEFMLSDSQASVLLTQQKLSGQFMSLGNIQVVCLDEDSGMIAQQSSQNSPARSKPDNLAYVIYTSGSTGKPKGVQIEHRSVVNFLLSMQKTPGITDQDILLSVTTLSFDIAGLELFLPLITGAQVELVSRETAGDGWKLKAALESSGATVMQATPVTWRVLIESGWQGNDSFKVLCGGEMLSLDLAHQLIARCAQLWNMYGPTETTIWSTVSRVGLDDAEITIGRPIESTQCYVLDQSLQPVPVGVPGELYIGGDGVARGYLNRDELTKERFIPDPFNVQHPGRLYRTGDLVKYLPDGRIHYLSRVDNQVKIRGFRIELGEIESVLIEHPAVRTAVVIVREDNPGDKRIISYLVLNDDAIEPSSSELRTHVHKYVPEYMVPAAFVFIKEFPLTPNNKIDRKALPAPEQTRTELAHQYVAPRDEIEQSLVAIMEDILKLDRVGIHDNFFELGGHSLLATQVISRIQQNIHVLLPLRSLFESPTVAEVALLVLEEKLAQLGNVKAMELLADVEQLARQDRFTIPKNGD